MKKLLIAAAVLMAVPGAAEAAPPNPFGHACTPQNGVLFCPTASDAERVPSFDGVPMDVDVTLPASGNGPFPTIVLIHGWGGSKRKRATIATRGRGGMIAARLWDVHQGQQTLVARGVYRLTDNQKGRIVFQLFGNGWRFAKGQLAKLELLGSDPNFVRPSNFEFTVRASKIGVELPGR
jgi:hypothetical protein